MHSNVSREISRVLRPAWPAATNVQEGVAKTIQLFTLRNHRIKTPIRYILLPLSNPFSPRVENPAPLREDLRPVTQNDTRDAPPNQDKRRDELRCPPDSERPRRLAAVLWPSDGGVDVADDEGLARFGEAVGGEEEGGAGGGRG